MYTLPQLLEVQVLLSSHQLRKTREEVFQRVLYGEILGVQVLSCSHQLGFTLERLPCD